MKNFVWRWFFVFYKIQYRTIGARYSTPNKRKYTHTNELFLGIVNAIDSFISCSARFETLWNKTWSALFCFLIDNRWFGEEKNNGRNMYGGIISSATSLSNAISAVFTCYISQWSLKSVCLFSFSVVYFTIFSSARSFWPFRANAIF